MQCLRSGVGRKTICFNGNFYDLGILTSRNVETECWFYIDCRAKTGWRHWSFRKDNVFVLLDGYLLK